MLSISFHLLLMSFSTVSLKTFVIMTKEKKQLISTKCLPIIFFLLDYRKFLSILLRIPWTTEMSLLRNDSDAADKNKLVLKTAVHFFQACTNFSSKTCSKNRTYTKTPPYRETRLHLTSDILGVELRWKTWADRELVVIVKWIFISDEGWNISDFLAKKMPYWENFEVWVGESSDSLWQRWWRYGMDWIHWTVSWLLGAFC
jgi:hypothetical protein